ncbi:MAG: hypothetical protein KDI12_24825 [Anaerolineae bacterium]|nr:hypothetical protein [Anaerolineae bacterium]
MGLDITAYSRLKFIERIEPVGDKWGSEIWEDKYWGTGQNTVYVSGYDQFPGRRAPLAIPPGRCVDVYSYFHSLDFRAGSYSGYNWWRNELSLISSGMSAENVWSSEKAVPFYELINFSDAEGVIGSVACKELLADFEQFSGDAQRHKDPWFWEAYQKWHQAVQLGADDGMIEFH